MLLQGTLLLVGLVASAQGLFFNVEEGNQRCFIEDVPQDTLVLLKYSNPDFIPWGSEAFDGRSIKLTVADPNKRIVSAEEAAKAVSDVVHPTRCLEYNQFRCRAVSPSQLRLLVNIYSV